MKVICIDKGISERPDITIPPLVEGETYTVISSKNLFSIIYNKYFFCYEVAEMKGWYHAAELFIPLSQIDETEMNRSYHIFEIHNKN